MIRRSTFDTNFKLDEEHKSEAAKDSYHVSVSMFTSMFLLSSNQISFL